MNARTPEPIRVLVADDELPARQRLMDLLCRDEQIATVSEAADGQTTVEMIQKENPDLLFLDVQMPELDGLGVIGAIGAAQMPLTVFVTAFDQHAIRAFEANALDYLLKPFSDERFEATMVRAKSRLDERSMRDFGHRVMKMVSSAPPTPERRLDRLVVKSGGTTRFIRVIDIDWIEAAGVYVTLHVGGKELLYRAALNDLAEKLDPRRFVRVHRSATRVSRTYRSQLEKRLGQPL